jgi:teichuronic acid biosynthesis glycosyltransferase TuaG
MLTSDLVSIVTPAYNAARYIKAAISSAINQTYPNWEMIIADDCSSDRTREIVADFAERDSRIKLVAQKANQGPALTRNGSIERAQGRFIAFLDSDDWWLPEKLEHQLAFMADRHIAISYTQFRRVDQSGENAGRLIKIPKKLTYRQLLGNTAIATSTAIVDRALTGDFRMAKTYYDDFALWLKLLRAGFIAEGLQEDLMRYRIVQGSVSYGKINSAKKVWATYRDIEGFGPIRSSIYFSFYTYNAIRKYRSF